MHWVNEDLIIKPLEASSSEDAIRILGARLFESGYVRDTYVDAVLEREKVFATGLPTPEIQVAIPHTDIEHVIRPAIAVGVLQDTVEFVEMGNPDGIVNVSIVCMLAVNQSDSLVSLLQNLVGIFQDPAVLHQIVDAGDISEIDALFNDRLPPYQEA
ncbi:MAG: PTS sugar transporter subunit IIA [Anaerolineales bacterium]|jgi:PTS system galactitol-specific IIA component